MNEQPSWKTSTLSQIAFISVICYELACLMLIIGGGIYKEASLITAGFSGLRWSTEAFVVGYLARAQVLNKQNGNGNGNGKPPEPAAEKPPGAPIIPPVIP